MLFNRLVFRTWGWYLVLLDRKHFKVKLLRFKKWSELSFQRHFHRGEAWCVLRGIGNKGDCEDGFFTGVLSSGDYWHIGKERWHKFQATTVTWILEVQYGEKCVEEDIVRLT